jgi:hypothetical protein
MFVGIYCCASIWENLLSMETRIFQYSVLFCFNNIPRLKVNPSREVPTQLIQECVCDWLTMI